MVQTRSWRKGLWRRSSPIEPMGPWPGMKAMSSSRVRIERRWSAGTGRGRRRANRSADRSLEQHVADEAEVHGRVDEQHAAGRVAGAMAHAEGGVAERDHVAVRQPAVLHHVAAGEAEQRRGRLLAVEQELVAGMGALDGHAELVAQVGGAAGVIGVAVGEQDLFDLRPESARWRAGSAACRRRDRPWPPCRCFRR